MTTLESVAAFWSAFATPQLPALGPEARADRLPREVLAMRLKAFVQQQEIGSGIVERLLWATVLLWHDHLEASHAVSQGIPTADGSFLHGIMHRREPDAANAQHWFHRVGRHAAFLEIARRATPWLHTHTQPELARQLVPNGLWDAFAFIDACDAARSTPPDNPQRQALQEVQRFECEALVVHFLAEIAPGATQ